jgi:hypothetical protein
VWSKTSLGGEEALGAPVQPAVDGGGGARRQAGPGGLVIVTLPVDALVVEAEEVQGLGHAPWLSR